MSSGALSHEDAIGQFCGVTGADEERAKGLLEACDWNLELAINMHVDTDDGRGNNKPSTSNSSAAGPSTSKVKSAEVISINDEPSIEDEDSVQDVLQSIRRPPPMRRIDGALGGGVSRNSGAALQSDDIRPPIPPVRQVLVQHPVAYSSDLPQRRYNTRPGANSEVYDAFRDFQAEAQWQEMAQQEGESSSANPSDSANSNSSANKRRTLQELFRPPLEIMFRGSLVSAREAGTLQNKWLLVNIQNGREFACQILNRDVWSNQTVKDILKEHFVFWQVYHDSLEGSRYIQFYKVSSFPHVSIIDPRTGEQMKSWPTSIDHNSFCDSVIEFLTEHPSPDGSSDANSMKKLRVKEEEEVVVPPPTLYDQSEEAQLEAAIKASLQETENSNSPKEDEASRDEIIIEDYKDYLGVDSEKFSDLVVRFPDGSRDQFKFPSDSLMKALFLLLTSRGYGMNQYNYVTTFPRRLLNELPGEDTLQDAKLFRETIFVERRVSDS